MDHILLRGDLARGEQNVRVVEHGRLVFRIGDEVGGNITLVEAHALGEIEIEAEAVVVFDGDDAILSDLVESLGDLLAHLGVTCGNRCGCSNLFLGLHRLRGSDKLLDESVGSLLDAAAQGNRIGSGHHVLQTLMHEGLCKYSCGGGAIAGDIIGALGHFLHQFGTNALERILKIDLLGDRNAIVGDGRRAIGLVKHDVAALGTKRHLDGIGQLIQTGEHTLTSFLIVFNDLCHCSSTRNSCLPTWVRDGRQLPHPFPKCYRAD